MRILSVCMAAYLFLLPQLPMAQRMLLVIEEQETQAMPQLIEEEVLKHGVKLHEHVPVPWLGQGAVAHMHPWVEQMIGHPLREVPLRPPRC